LHLDIEADAIRPWVSGELMQVFKSEEERRNCVLFLHSAFSRQPGAVSLADIRLLRQSGFQLGVRNIGDGATNLENLLALAPQWVRLDPVLTSGAGRYKEKAASLRQWAALLAPLGAAMAAEECEGGEDLSLLGELGFASCYSAVIRGSGPS
jgi:EAL domain-containing protein (putative c-di-GMP-specific phosphodiesterase class I)